MRSVSGFDFYTLNFDKDGNLTDGNEFPAFRQAASGTATDAILIAHGFRNNVDDASRIYTNFLSTFRDNIGRTEFREISQRKYIVGGVFWPSKALPESFSSGADGGTQAADPSSELMAAAAEKLASLKDTVPEKAAALDEAAKLLPTIENDTDAQDQFTALVLSITEGNQLESTEGLELIQQQRGSDLLANLRVPVILPTQVDGSADGDSTGSVQSVDDGGTQSIGSFFGSILGGVDTFLNLTTWYVMKNRSGIVGMNGVAQAVRDLRAANGGLKIHLVGHSLGGRLMAGCAKSLARTPMVQPDSVTLLEAAFSHYGFSADIGDGTAGFFRDVITKGVVKGPLVETFSAKDTVVGLTYAVASRLAHDNVKAIGDANDEYGGIGRNGSQKTVESSFQPLKAASTLTAPYIFKKGVVNCIDGSLNLINDHGDITNENVTYAFASAVASTAEPVSAGAAG